MITPCSRIVIAMTFGFAMVGCGGKPSPRRAVHGSVRVGSSTDVDGSISFFPTDGHRGPVASTSIVSGQYQFTDRNGPYPGVHRVEVGITPVETDSAQRAPEGATASPDVGEGKQALLKPAQPKKKRSVATASAHKWDTKFDVPVEGDQRKDFAFEVTDP